MSKYKSTQSYPHIITLDLTSFVSIAESGRLDKSLERTGREAASRGTDSREVSSLGRSCRAAGCESGPAAPVAQLGSLVVRGMRVAWFTVLLHLGLLVHRQRDRDAERHHCHCDRLPRLRRDHQSWIHSHRTHVDHQVTNHHRFLSHIHLVCLSARRSTAAKTHCVGSWPCRFSFAVDPTWNGKQGHRDHTVINNALVPDCLLLNLVSWIGFVFSDATCCCCSGSAGVGDARSRLYCFDAGR
jgi:hypothetical protein